MEKCYKCGKDATPGRFIKVEDCWTQEGFHWYGVCEECYEKYGEGVHHVVHESEPKKMVKKVKLITSSDGSRLEFAVNNFIKDKNVICVKFTSVVVDQYHTTAVGDRVLIVYEEEE